MILNLSKIIVPAFYEFWSEARDGNYLYHVLKGGRNSGKSSVVAQRLIMDLIELNINILVIRKVFNTIRESAYEQLKEAIIQLKIENKFLVLKSPLEIIYIPKGNKVIFRGADDPAKIKSIKTSKFPIARLWIEELAEFKTEDEVQTIVDSILRAEIEGSYKIYFSYNPPKRRQSWVNKKFNTSMLAKNTYVHHSSYLDNPYVSAQMAEEAKELRSKSELKYRWNYMGEAIGGGIIPFDNLVFREITDDEIKAFDNIREGIDWGYAADPFVWVQMHYDRMRRKIFVYKEIYKIKLSNRLAAEMIKPLTKVKITCDVEPKSVAEMLTYGIRIAAAKKGSDSVEYGEKWLDDLDAIVIDPKRCPKIATEFEIIDYQTDRYGEIISRLEDKNNHGIDGIRYALESDMRRKPRGW